MPPETRPGSPFTQGASDALLAVSFLTILPVRATTPARGGIGAAAPYFPLVGALVGAAAGVVRVATEPLIGAGPATVLAIACLAIVTGGLHLDGLADTFDGLGVRHDRARRLRVMRDSSTGAFGVLALIAWALLVLTALTQLSNAHALAALVTAAAVGRLAGVAHAGWCPPARPDGLGAAFQPSLIGFVVAGLLALVIALATCGPLPGLAASLAALIAAALFSAGSRSSFGGRTGDTLGATITIAEAVTCLVLVAAWT